MVSTDSPCFSMHISCNFCGTASLLDCLSCWAKNLAKTEAHCPSKVAWSPVGHLSLEVIASSWMTLWSCLWSWTLRGALVFVNWSGKGLKAHWFPTSFAWPSQVRPGLPGRHGQDAQVSTSWKTFSICLWCSWRFCQILFSRFWEDPGMTLGGGPWVRVGFEWCMLLLSCDPEQVLHLILLKQVHLFGFSCCSRQWTSDSRFFNLLV
jgi:hypothetical protein